MPLPTIVIYYNSLDPGHFNEIATVSLNGLLSDPQGFCLSPLLFILYTNSCRSTTDRSFLVKFTDDIAMLSLLYNSQHDHSGPLPGFGHWRETNSRKKEKCKLLRSWM